MSRRLAATLVAAGLINAALTIPSAKAAQDEAALPVDQVIQIVQTFFDTMTAKDVEGARKILILEGRFHSVRNDNGQSTIRSFTNQEYVDGLAARESVALERMWDPKVTVHAQIANVWTRYDFYLDGEFSHCGVDSFDLIKTPEGWKISGGTYTVERTGCPESPLGPPN